MNAREECVRCEDTHKYLLFEQDNKICLTTSYEEDNNRRLYTSEQTLAHISLFNWGNCPAYYEKATRPYCKSISCSEFTAEGYFCTKCKGENDILVQNKQRFQMFYKEIDNNGLQIYGTQCRNRYSTIHNLQYAYISVMGRQMFTFGIYIYMYIYRIYIFI